MFGIIKEIWINFFPQLPESVVKARKLIGKGIYCLGAGGKNPTGELPWSVCAKPSFHSHAKLYSKPIFCDCSGFVCWCLGLPRHNSDDTWNNTDHLEYLASKHPVAWKDAQVGDVVVYGAGAAIGHTGIVSRVGKDGPTHIIHCSASGSYAVKEQGPQLWLKHKAVIFRKSLAFPE